MAALAQADRDLEQAICRDRGNSTSNAYVQAERIAALQKIALNEDNKRDVQDHSDRDGEKSPRGCDRPTRPAGSESLPAAPPDVVQAKRLLPRRWSWDYEDWKRKATLDWLRTEAFEDFMANAYKEKK